MQTVLHHTTLKNVPAIQTYGNGKWSTETYDHKLEAYSLRPYVTQDVINGGVYTVITTGDEYLLGRREVFRRRHHGPITLPYRQTGFLDELFIGGGTDILKVGAEAKQYAVKTARTKAFGITSRQFEEEYAQEKNTCWFTLTTNASTSLYRVIQLSSAEYHACHELLKFGNVTATEDKYTSFESYGLSDTLNKMHPNWLKVDAENFDEQLDLWWTISQDHNLMVAKNLKKINRHQCTRKKELAAAVELINENDFNEKIINRANFLLNCILNENRLQIAYSNANALQYTSPLQIFKEWRKDNTPRDRHYYFLQLFLEGCKAKKWNV